jgi:transmembrane sensor
MNEAGGPALPQPRKASEWMVALIEAPHDRDLRRRFDAWLLADPAHALDWQETSATFSALEDLRQERIARTAPKPAPAPRRRRAAAALAIAVAALLAIFAPTLWVRFQADHRTSVAEQRTIVLPDGSSAQLAPETAIDVAFDEKRRRIRLLKGEALFVVNHQADRTFSVEAGGVEVVDIGTAFDVRVRPNGAEVAVLEGLVEVGAPLATPAVRERLQAGDWLRAVAQRPVERGQMPLEEVASWTRKRLVVKNRPVADIVDALRPYFDGMILVRGAGLAEARLTGVYDLTQPVEALRAVARAQGATVREITPWVVILSARQE